MPELNSFFNTFGLDFSKIILSEGYNKKLPNAAYLEKKMRGKASVIYRRTDKGEFYAIYHFLLGEGQLFVPYDGAEARHTYEPAPPPQPVDHEADYTKRMKSFELFASDYASASQITEQSTTYLNKKGLGGIVFPRIRESTDRYGHYISFPLYSPEKTKCGYQKIYDENVLSDGTRDKDFRFLPKKDGMTAKIGSYFPLGKPSTEEPLYICEGLSTGASVHVSTGNAVIVALDAGNLMPVASYFQSLGYKPIIAGDYDYKELNGKVMTTGQDKSIACSKALDIPYTLPVNEGKVPMDWNDYYVKYGAVETAKRLKDNEKNACEEGLSLTFIPANHKGFVSRLHTLYQQGLANNAKQAFAVIDPSDYGLDGGITLVERELEKIINAPKIYPAPPINCTDLYDARPLGAGKTTDFVKHQSAQKKTTIVTPRIAIAKKLAIDTKRPFYQDKGAMADKDGCVTTINSLSNPAMNLKPDDVFAVDEIEQVMDALAGGLMEARKAEESYYALKRRIQTAKSVMAMDAFPSNSTIDWISQLRGYAIPVRREKPTPRNVNVIQLKNRKVTLSESIKQLEEGKKVIILSTSKGYVQTLQHALKDTIDRLELKACFLNADDRDGEEAFISDPNKFISEHDLIVLSPVISASISITVPVDAIFVDVKAGITRASDVMQQIGRFRVPATIYLRCDQTQQKPSQRLLQHYLDREANDVLSKMSLTQRLLKIQRPKFDDDTCVCPTGFVFSEFDKFVIKRTAEQKYQSALVHPLLIALLKEYGYRLQDGSITTELENANELYAQAKEKKRETRIDALCKAKNITKDECDDLKKNFQITPEEKLSVEKYYIGKLWNTEQVSRSVIETDYDHHEHALAAKTAFMPKRSFKKDIWENKNIPVSKRKHNALLSKIIRDSLKASGLRFDGTSVEKIDEPNAGEIYEGKAQIRRATLEWNKNRVSAITGGKSPHLFVLSQLKSIGLTFKYSNGTYFVEDSSLIFLNEMLARLIKSDEVQQMHSSPIKTVVEVAQTNVVLDEILTHAERGTIYSIGYFSELINFGSELVVRMISENSDLFTYYKDREMFSLI